MNRLLAWLRKIYRLLVLLAAIFGVQPGKPPMPTAPQITPPAITPPPPPPAKKVDGAMFTLPEDFPTRAAAQQAIRDFRAANP